MARLALQSPAFRRRQMLTIVAHTVLIPLCLSAFFIICAAPSLWPLILLYGLFMAMDPRAESGAVLSPLQVWFRNTRWWRWFAGYYPVVVHKTADLEPCFKLSNRASASEPQEADPHAHRRPLWIRARSFMFALIAWWYCTLTGQSDKYAQPTGRKYIFGYHPHGIIGMGVVGGVATNGANWNKLFPGVPVRLLTIASNFKLPLYREYLLSAGIGSVSRSSCLRLLENGNPICIVVGGARESLLAEPGRMDLILAKRFGFVKIALQTGAALVPVVGFGENDIYEQAKLDQGAGANLHKYMTSHFGYTIPLFHARGIFNYDKGIMPYRRPIHVVVGKPIEIPQLTDPDHETIQHYHDLYVKELRQLYNDNRAKYLPDATDLYIADGSEEIKQ